MSKSQGQIAAVGCFEYYDKGHDFDRDGTRTRSQPVTVFVNSDSNDVTVRDKLMAKFRECHPGATKVEFCDYNGKVTPYKIAGQSLRRKRSYKAKPFTGIPV